MIGLLSAMWHVILLWLGLGTLWRGLAWAGSWRAAPGPTAVGDPGLVRAVDALRPRRHGPRRLGVVLVTPSGRVRTATAGCDGSTRFEVGSVTKLFTGLLTADLAEHAGIDLAGRLDRLIPDLPPEVGEIRPVDLATHRSGLARIAIGPVWLLRLLLAQPFLLNPYAGTTRRGVIRSAQLSVRLGAARRRGSLRYSNLGAALLGQALASAQGASFDALVTERLLGPLEMTATTFTRPAGMRRGRHHGSPAALWRLGAYAPAGGLASNLEDLTRFAQALATRSAPGIAALEPVRDGQGLFWFLDRDAGGRYAWHNGQTGGFSAYLRMGLEPGQGVLIAVADSADAERLGQMCREIWRAEAVGMTDESSRPVP